jgi:hypothetical protein
MVFEKLILLLKLNGVDGLLLKGVLFLGWDDTAVAGAEEVNSLNRFINGFNSICF